MSVSCATLTLAALLVQSPAMMIQAAPAPAAQPANGTPDRPDPAYFQRLDERVKYMNSKGIIADLILADDENQLAKLFPEWQQRERYIRYLVARYAPLNITWQGVQEFEEYPGRPRAAEGGRHGAEEDGPLSAPPHHPHALTSAPLLDDGWMDYVAYQSSDDQLGAIEHQLFAVPFVNVEFADEDSGAGKPHPHHVDTDTFRRRLWNIDYGRPISHLRQHRTYGAAAAGGPQYLDSPGRER